jgi:hypothetical protein
MEDNMRKISVTIAAAILAFGSSIALAQNVSPFKSDPKVIPMPLLAGCGEINEVSAMLDNGGFEPIIRGTPHYVQKDKTIRQPNDDTSITIWYNPKTKVMVPVSWSKQLKVACFTNTIEGITFDESAWQSIGRQANLQGLSE